MNTRLVPCVLALCLGCLGHSRQQYLDSSWMACKWDGGDGQYRQARREIEAVAGSPLILDSAISRYRERCLSNRPTHMDLFKWSWAVICRAKNDFDYSWKVRNETDFRSPYLLFPKLSVPGSYEFTRVRFLFTTSFDFPHRHMVRVGEAVLKREPSDIPTMLSLVYILQPHAFAEDAAKGARLVSTLDRMGAKDLRALRGTGYYFYRKWLGGHSIENAKEATKRLSAAKALSKSEDERAFIDELIQEMRTKGP